MAEGEGGYKPPIKDSGQTTIPEFAMTDDLRAIVDTFPKPETVAVFTALDAVITSRIISPKNQETARGITLTALSEPAFLTRIKSPEDLERYARKVLEMEIVLTDINSKQPVMEVVDPMKPLVRMDEIPHRVVGPAVGLTREDFDGDLDTLTNILRHGRDSRIGVNIIQRMSQGASGFIKSSADLKRFERIVEALSQNGHKPWELFGGENTEFGKSPLFPSLPPLDQRLSDEGKRRDLLDVLEEASLNGLSLTDFTKHVSHAPSERLDSFVSKSKLFLNKGIPPQYIIHLMSQPQNDIESWDSTKDGLDIFPGVNSQLDYLKFCLAASIKNPRLLERFSPLFNKALEDDSPELAAQRLLSLDFREVLRTKLQFGSSLLGKIQQLVPRSGEIIARTDDRESRMQSSRDPQTAEDYGGYLGDPETVRAFPLTMAKVRKAVIEWIDIETISEGIAPELAAIQDLPAKVAYGLVKNGYSSQVIENLPSFVDIEPEKLLEAIINSGNVIDAVKYNKNIGYPDKDLVTVSELLDEFVTKSSYELVKTIRSGTITADELREIGISRTGDAGINQLRERLARFKTEILSPDFDPAILLKLDFLKQYFKRLIRFDESEFGEHGDDAFNNVLEDFLELKAEGALNLLPEWFMESGEVRVNNVDRVAQESYEFSEHFRTRYDTLKNSLKDAVDLLGKPAPLSHIADKATAKRNVMLAKLREKLSSVTNERAIDDLSAKIGKLENMNIRDVRNFQENFATLAQFEEFGSELRELAFFYALQQNKDYIQGARKIITQDSPSFDDAQWMINFVGHIVNEETWKKVFSDKKALKAFRSLVDIKTLEKEFARAQNQGSMGTTPIEFIPNRGVLLEFSGHIADACWASTYQSISYEYENLSSVVMVQNRGTKNERLAGASLLIESTDVNGDKVLIIRGLNPIENIINSLQVEDFYKKICGLCQTTCAAK